ncbi:hypothetical protein ABEB36_000112 [Hypothenemus hampei]|uniref:Regulatory protein zeste n=1 Tax=Hypothenemus hampei TaxID=57062 RepID=A0ABD1FAA5_HYPHA
MSAFTAIEKNALISLVQKFKNIIETKKTDATTNKAKADAWMQIGVLFNSRFPTRSDKQLKKLWDNLKNRTRKIDTQYKYNILKTGGGPPPPSPADDAITQQIRSIVPTINFEIANEYDSNHLLTKNLNESSENSNNIEPLYIEENIENTQQTESIILNDLPYATTERPKRTNILQERKKRTNILQERKKRKVSGVRDSRSKLIDLEARLRIRKMRESIKQQTDLFEKKMSVLESERKYWEKKFNLDF